jgi:hypothetical protein
VEFGACSSHTPVRPSPVPRPQKSVADFELDVSCKANTHAPSPWSPPGSRVILPPAALICSAVLYTSLVLMATWGCVCVVWGGGVKIRQVGVCMFGCVDAGAGAGVGGGGGGQGRGWGAGAGVGGRGGGWEGVGGKLCVLG